MSDIIKDLLTEYGLGIDNEIVYNSLVSFLAVIVMLGIILMISKLVSPSASRTRAVLTTAVIVVSAILIVFNAVVSIGGNVIIREEIVENNNANIEIIETYQMNVVAEQEIIESYESSAVDILGLGLGAYSVYEIEVTDIIMLYDLLDAKYIDNEVVYDSIALQAYYLVYGIEFEANKAKCIFDMTTYESGKVYFIREINESGILVNANITTTLH